MKEKTKPLCCAELLLVYCMWHHKESVWGTPDTRPHKAPYVIGSCPYTAEELLVDGWVVVLNCLWQDWTFSNPLNLNIVSVSPGFSVLNLVFNIYLLFYLFIENWLFSHNISWLKFPFLLCLSPAIWIHSLSVCH